MRRRLFGRLQFARFLDLSALPCRRRPVSWSWCPLRPGMALGRRFACLSPIGGSFPRNQCARADLDRAGRSLLVLEVIEKRPGNSVPLAKRRDRHGVDLVVMIVVIGRRG